MPEFFQKNKYSLLLLAVGLVIFVANLDAIYVNIMEARNFITAREMLTHDNWLLTTLNDMPRYQKPPLPTWLTALSGVIFGFDSLYAMRLPAALSTLLLLFYFFRFVPQLNLSQKQAFISSLILASSFYIVFSGRNGQWDIFTHAFMMVSIYYLWHFFSHHKNHYQNAVLAGIFLGFSFMSKGPVSLYALFLPFLISYGIIYRYREFGQKWKPFTLFLLIAIVLGTWWFIYVRLADPAAFLKIAEKETTNWGSYNIRPFYYYWSFFTQSGIWTIPSFVALLYPYLKNRVSNKKAYQFTLLWTLASVILLSLIPEKKSRYLLPVLIPMAMNTGFYAEYLFRSFRELKKKESWVVYFNHGLIALIGIAFPVAGYFLLELEGNYWFWYICSSLFLFGTGVAMFYYLKNKNYPKVFYLTVAFICGIILFAFPLTGSFLHNPKFNNISKLRSLAEKEDIKVYEYQSFSPELIWEYGKPLPMLKEDSLILPNEERFGLIMQKEDTIELANLKRNYRVTPVERYDLNYVNPEKRGYKDRLIRWFYILEKR